MSEKKTDVIPENVAAVMNMPFPDPEREPDDVFDGIPIYRHVKGEKLINKKDGGFHPIEVSDPLPARSAIELFNRGVSLINVTQMTNISRGAAMNLRSRFQSVMPDWRERVHKKLHSLTHTALEHMGDQLSAMGPRDISIASGILLDKLDKFSSIPPQNGENDHSGRTVVNIQNIFSALPKPEKEPVDV